MNILIHWKKSCGEISKGQTPEFGQGSGYNDWAPFMRRGLPLREKKRAFLRGALSRWAITAAAKQVAIDSPPAVWLPAFHSDSSFKPLMSLCVNEAGELEFGVDFIEFIADFNQQ